MTCHISQQLVTEALSPSSGLWTPTSQRQCFIDFCISIITRMWFSHSRCSMARWQFSVILMVISSRSLKESNKMILPFFPVRWIFTKTFNKIYYSSHLWTILKELFLFITIFFMLSPDLAHMVTFLTVKCTQNPFCYMIKTSKPIL